MSSPSPLTPEHDASLADVRQARVVLEWLRTQEQQLSHTRDQAILVLVAAGFGYEVISQASGLTRGRISQIVNREQNRSNTPPDMPAES